MAAKVLVGHMVLFVLFCVFAVSPSSADIGEGSWERCSVVYGDITSRCRRFARHEPG